ncbi:hypothetical protein [Halalkalibacter wakoensis]|uniref:hypothetical protein n=1 Tax=Halalkalibacter wakoensis TaxID=127891 RepID=UPI00068E57B9|nr:hypothetical protein [Halalkalibacter wakoensis]
MKKILICVQCGSPFTATNYEVRTGRKYCSRDCSHKSRDKKVTINCVQCGEEKKYSPIYIKRGSKYCSSKCRNEAMQITLACEVCKKHYTLGKRFKDSKYCSQECTHEAQKDQVEITCPNCNESRMVQRAHSERKYCNRECMHEHYRRFRVFKECECCGEEFEIVPSRKDEAHYCSQNCAAAMNMQKGKIGLWGFAKQHKRQDLGVRFRSSWEANYARILNAQDIPWEFEPTRFKLSDGSIYIPDFYLGNNHYVEVKGWWTELSQAKVALFLKDYPEIHLEIIDKDKYKILENSWKEKIEFWESY